MARARRKTRRRKTCVVIGAGLAGLAAAYKLAKAGWRVKVFEAQERPGGRVLSHRFTLPDGTELTCELGAEWIGNSHTRIKALCRQLGLKIERHQYSTKFWIDEKPGDEVCKPEDPTVPKELDEAYADWLDEFSDMSFAEQRSLDDLDWWTKLKEIGFTEKQLRQRELEDGTDFGESIRMSSAYVAATEYASSSDSDELDFKIKGGNDRLPNALVRAIRELGGTVSFGAIVESISPKGRRVRLGIRGRRPVSAALCICAVPATRLEDFEWSPEPEEHLYAARRLQYSRITKTAVLFEKRFWAAWKEGQRDTGFAVFTNRVADFCFESTFRDRRTDAGILCTYSFGEKAANISSESHANLARWIYEDVMRAQGKAPSRFRKWSFEVKPKPWHDDEWARGAYAFYRPGQWFAIRPVLQRPFGRVVFAGEHLADESGFMESAIKSGEAAAAFATGD